MKLKTLDEVRLFAQAQQQKTAVLISGQSGSGKTTLAKTVFEPLKWKIADTDKLAQNLPLWSSDPVIQKISELKMILEKASPAALHRSREQWANEWGIQLKPFEFDHIETVGNCRRAKQLWYEIREEAPDVICNILFSPKIPGLMQYLPNTEYPYTGLEGYFLSHKRICEKVKDKFISLGYCVMEIRCFCWSGNSPQMQVDLERLATCEKSPMIRYEYGYQVNYYSNKINLPNNKVVNIRMN